MERKEFCKITFEPHPLFFQDDDSPSLSSLQNQQPRTEMIFCESCKHGAFLQFVGDVGEIKKSSTKGVKTFLCDCCRFKEDGQKSTDVKCLVCTKSGGLMRIVHQNTDQESSKKYKNVFCHYVCGLTSNKIKVNSFVKMEFALDDASKLPEKRYASICDICGIKGGQMMKCENSSSDCPRYLHLYCFMKARVEGMVIEGNEKDLQEYWSLTTVIEGAQNFKLNSIAEEEGVLSPQFLGKMIDFSEIEMAQENLEMLDNSEEPLVKQEISEKLRLSNLLKGASQASLAEEIPNFMKWIEDESKIIQHQTSRYQFHCPEHRGSVMYCFCNQQKHDNFISCDSCQVWYHCSCVNIRLDQIDKQDKFTCSKCKTIKDCVDRNQLPDSLADFFAKSRMEFGDLLVLAQCLEKKLHGAGKNLFATLANWSRILPFNIAHVSLNQRKRLLFFEYIVWRIVNHFNLKLMLFSDTDSALNSRGYRDCVVIHSELQELKKACQNRISESLAQQLDVYIDSIEGYLSYVKEVYAQTPNFSKIISLAKFCEQNGHIRDSPFHKKVLKSMKVLSGILKEMMEIFLEFEQRYSSKASASINFANILKLDELKIASDFAEKFHQRIDGDEVQSKLFQSMLEDFSLTQYPLDSEQVSRLDILIQIVKKKSYRMIRNDQEDFFKKWEELSSVMNRAKKIMSRIEYLKEDNEFCRDMYEYKDPVSQICTISQAQDVVLDAENHLILANSPLIRVLKTVIDSSLEFHSRFKGPHWHKIDAAKRYIQNMLKGGLLADESAIMYIEEIKIYCHLQNLARKKPTRPLNELKSLLENSGKKFATDIYEKSTIVIDSLIKIVEVAGELEKVNDDDTMFSDQHISKCLAVWSDIYDFNLESEGDFSKVKTVHNLYTWVATLIPYLETISFPKPENEQLHNIEFKFKESVDIILENVTLIDELNTKAQIKLSRIFNIHTLKAYPRLFEIYKYVAYRVWHRDFEEVAYNQEASTIILDDLKSLEDRFVKIFGCKPIKERIKIPSKLKSHQGEAENINDYIAKAKEYHNSAKKKKKMNKEDQEAQQEASNSDPSSKQLLGKERVISEHSTAREVPNSEELPQSHGLLTPSKFPKPIPVIEDRLTRKQLSNRKRPLYQPAFIAPLVYKGTSSVGRYFTQDIDQLYPKHLQRINQAYFLLVDKLNSILDKDPLSQVSSENIPELKDTINKILYFTDFAYFDPLTERLLFVLSRYTWLLKNFQNCHMLLHMMGDGTQASKIEISKEQLKVLFDHIGKVRGSICGSDFVHGYASTSRMIKEEKSNRTEQEISSLSDDEEKVVYEQLKQGWLPEITRILELYDQRFGPSVALEEEYQGIKKLVKLSKESISIHKKEKNLTPMVVLEVLKQKPALSNAIELIKKFESLGMIFVEFKKELTDMVDQTVLLTHHVIGFLNDTSFLKKFQTKMVGKPTKEEFADFESKLLKLWKKTELCPLYSPKLYKTMMNLDVSYKILKLIYSSTNQRKWERLDQQISKLIESEPGIKDKLVSSKLYTVFQQQKDIITKITRIVLEEEIDLEQLKELPELISKCLADDLEKINLSEFRKETLEVIRIIVNLRPQETNQSISRQTVQKIGQEEYSRGVSVIQNYSLSIKDKSIQDIFKTKDLYDQLLEMANVGKREKLLKNGYFVETILSKYESCRIEFSLCQNMIHQREQSLAIYSGIKEKIRSMGSETKDFRSMFSQNFLASQLQRSQISWESTNIIIKLMLWIRLADCLKNGSIKFSFSSLKSQYSEMSDLYQTIVVFLDQASRSLLTQVLVEKVEYVETIISEAAVILQECSMCNSSEKFERKISQTQETAAYKILDLTEELIDIRTQIELGNIEFKHEFELGLSTVMRQVVPKKPQDQVNTNWFIQTDFDKLEKIESALEEIQKSNIRKKVFGILKNDGSIGSGSLNLLTGERLLASSVLTKRTIKPNQNFNLEAGQGVEQMLIKENRQVEKHANSSEFIGIDGISQSQGIPLTSGTKIQPINRMASSINHTGVKIGISPTLISNNVPPGEVSGLNNLTSSAMEEDEISPALRARISGQLVQILKQNIYFQINGEAMLKVAKQLESKLLAENYPDKTAYENSFLKLRSLFKALEHLRKLSKKLEGSQFDSEYLRSLLKLDELELKTHDRLLPEPESPQDARTYDPLFSGENPAVKRVPSNPFELKSQGKGQVTSHQKSSLLRDMYEDLKVSQKKKQSKLSNLFGGNKGETFAEDQIEAAEQEKMRSPKTRRENSEDSSRSRLKKPKSEKERREKRSRSRDREKEQRKEKKDKKDKKKKDKDKKKSKSQKRRKESNLKFSSDSCSGVQSDNGEFGEFEKDQNARQKDNQYDPLNFTPAILSASQTNPKGISLPSFHNANQLKPTEENDSMLPSDELNLMQNQQRPDGLAPKDSILSLEFPRKKIAIFESDAHKDKNEGYSTECSFYTTQDAWTLTTFPEINRQPRFIMKKFARQITDLEDNFLKRLQQIKKNKLNAASDIMLTGWVVPEKPKKVESLIRYLKTEEKALGCSVSPAMSLYITHASLLQEKTLEQIGIKPFYPEIGHEAKIDARDFLVFFLKKKEDVALKIEEKLKYSVIQEYDQEKEKLIKVKISSYSEIGSSMDADVRKNKKQAGQSQNEQPTEQPIQTSNDSTDDGLSELLNIFKNCQPEAIKTLFSELKDEELKKKLISILKKHFPHLEYIIKEETTLQPQTNQSVMTQNILQHNTLHFDPRSVQNHHHLGSHMPHHAYPHPHIQQTNFIPQQNQMYIPMVGSVGNNQIPNMGMPPMNPFMHSIQSGFQGHQGFPFANPQLQQGFNPNQHMAHFNPGVANQNAMAQENIAQNHIQNGQQQGYVNQYLLGQQRGPSDGSFFQR